MEFLGKQDAEEKCSLSTSLSFVNDNVNVKGSAVVPIQSRDSTLLQVDSALRYPNNMYWGTNLKYRLGATKPDWNARIQLKDVQHQMGLHL